MPTKRPKSPGPDLTHPASPAARGAGRSAALTFLKKKYPTAFEPITELGGVSTGSVAVDHIVGNTGFPRGRISEVFGIESSGKSTLCQTACAKAQQTGLYAVYIDAERGVDKNYARNLGFDTDDPAKGGFFLPDTFEETLDFIDKMVESDADLILVDSVPALVPDSVMQGEISEVGMFGQAARLLAAALPRLAKKIERTHTALVFVNQLRANIVTDAYAAKFAPKEKSFGGYALRYYSSLRIELKQTDKKAKTREMADPTKPGKMIEVPVASRHTALTFKSKVSQPYRQIEFFIRYDPIAGVWGIDNLQTRIDIARVKGVISEKAGGAYSFTAVDGTPVALRGADGLYDYFQSHPDAHAMLKDKIGV